MAGVIYFSWADNTGYAVAAKAYIRLLLTNGVNVNWQPMLPGRSGYQLNPDIKADCPLLQRALADNGDYDTVIIHMVPEYYPDLVSRLRALGKRVFGYTVWEHETLPLHWPAILNTLDAVLLPCSWNIQVFQQSGVKVPVHVVAHLPQVAETEPSLAEQQALRKRLGATIADGSFIFYNINFWSERKAPLLTIRAFLTAFTAADQVVLIVKTTHNDVTRYVRRLKHAFRLTHPSPLEALPALLAEFSNPPPVLMVCDETLTEGELAALHQMGDCFLSLTRTEGWGLAAYDAARLGKPVVMTEYGGQTDYLSEDYPWRVPYRLVPVNEPLWRSSYKAGDLWAEADLAAAVKMLRDIRSSPEQARQRAGAHASFLKEKFSAARIFQQLHAVLQ